MTEWAIAADRDSLTIRECFLGMLEEVGIVDDEAEQVLIQAGKEVHWEPVISRYDLKSSTLLDTHTNIKFFSFNLGKAAYDLGHW